MSELSNPTRVYFHIDELSRDSIVASALKKTLKKYNINLIYGNRRVTRSLLPYFANFFDVIILPRPAFLSIFQKKPKYPKILIIFTEAVGRYATKDNDIFVLKSFLGAPFMSGDTSLMDKVDKLLLWGDSVSKRILNYYPELNSKIDTIGNPRIDDMCVTNNRSHKFKNKKIGFITRFPLLNDFEKRSPLDKLIRWAFSTDEFNDKYELINKLDNIILKNTNVVSDVFFAEIADIITILELIKIFDKKGYEIHFKVHPREDKDYWNKIFKKYDIDVKIPHWLIPFSEWSADMDFVIGPASTAFYDCIRNETTPICLRYIFPKREVHVAQEWEDNGALIKHIPCPKSIDELLNIIESNYKIKKNNDILEVMRSEANYSTTINNQISKYVNEIRNLRVQKRNIFATQIFYFLSLYLLNLIGKIKMKFNRKKIQGSDFFIDKSTKNFIDRLAK